MNALEAEGRITQTDLQERTALSKTKLSRALNRLEELDAIEIESDGLVRRISDGAALQGKADEASDAQFQLHQAELERIEKMRLYAENLECRRAFLLGYFGEDTAGGCGNCDNCQGEGTERARLIAEKKMHAAAENAPAI